MREANRRSAARRDRNTSPAATTRHGATLRHASSRTWHGRGAACYFRGVRRLGLAVLLATAGGCQDDEGAHVVRKTIGRDGGQVSSHDGVLTLTFQPGSLPGATEIEIFPSDTPPPIFGPAYRVKPDILLELPMDVTYRRVLPNDPVGTAIAVIRKADYDAGTGYWRPLPVTELDPDNDLIGGIDSELSLFYALQEDAFDPTPSTSVDPSTTTEDPTTTEPDESDTMEPETSDTEVIPALSYAADVEPIFAENCTDVLCHSDGANRPNLATNGYDNIVGAAAVFASVPLVEPGDATRSYLMHKVDGTHDIDAALGGCGCNGAGLSMPQGEALLPMDTRAVIREWIDGGAEP